MRVNLPTKDLVRNNSGRQRVMLGVWTIREPEGSVGVSNGDLGRMRKGEFWARQEGTSTEPGWSVYMFQEASRTVAPGNADGRARWTELCNLEELLHRGGIGQLDEIMDASQSEGPNGDHRDLMGVLKEELEARHGQFRELQVVFQQIQPPTAQASWNRHWQGSKWRRLWQRFSAS